jgi:hypothetical protein
MAVLGLQVLQEPQVVAVVAVLVRSWSIHPAP